jgi:protein-S-isoprenylcysteine O-methyltransferase Ste14
VTRDWTFPVVVGAIGAGVLLALLAYHETSAAISSRGVATTVGVTIAVCGVAFRMWAIAVLGRFWRVTVQIQPDHHVVEKGPYRVLRHPSYTGLLLACAGAGIAFNNWLSLLAMIALPLAGILIRIRVEEAALERALGPSYIAYEARTKRLIPGVW